MADSVTPQLPTTNLESVAKPAAYSSTNLTTQIAPQPKTSNSQIPSYTTASTTPISEVTPPPAVVTAKDAVKEVSKMNTFATEQTQGMADQSKVVAQTQAQADAKAAADKQAADAAAAQKVAQDQKQQEIDQKAALAKAATGESEAPLTDTDRLAKLGAQFDGANFYNVGNSVYKDGNFVGTMDELRSGKLSEKLSAQPKQKTIAEQLQASQEESQKSIDDAKAKVQSFSNGTFKLSDDEQAEVTALQKQFDSLIEQQKIYNKNYEKGVEILGISQGISRYAPQLQLDKIQEAVNAGLAKVADIEVKAASAISQLKKSLKDEDYAKAQDAYNMARQSMQDKTNAIKDVAAAVKQQTDEEFAKMKDSRDFLYKQTQDTFDNSIKSENLSLDQKKAVLDEYIQKANLLGYAIDEKGNKISTQKAIEAAEQKWKDEQDIAIKKQAADPFSGALTGSTGVPVQVSPTGEPNKAQQAAFLATLPADMQAEVKGLTDYSMNPANISNKANRREMVLNLAKQYDPSFDESQFAARAQFNKNWTSGDLNNTKLAINTGINHLSELAKAASDLQNEKFKSFGVFTKNYNTIENLIKDNQGDPRVQAYNSAANKVAAELAKIYKGTASPTESEIQEERRTLDLGLSPEQLNSVISTSVNLVAGKLVPLNEQYVNTMGRQPENNVIGDSARKSIIDMRKSGINVDISKLDPGDEWRYMSQEEYMKNNPDQLDLMSQLLVKNPTMSETDLTDTLHLAKQMSSSGFNQPLSMGEKGSEVVAKVSSVSDGTEGGQCGHFVNQATGLGLGDSYQSKIDKMDPRIVVPQPGMVFTMPYKDTGHTGIILSINDGMATVKDSNWDLNEKVKTHQIPLYKMTGFAYPRTNIS